MYAQFYPLQPTWSVNHGQKATSQVAARIAETIQPPLARESNKLTVPTATFPSIFLEN